MTFIYRIDKAGRRVKEVSARLKIKDLYFIDYSHRTISYLIQI